MPVEFDSNGLLRDMFYVWEWDLPEVAAGVAGVVLGALMLYGFVQCWTNCCGGSVSFGSGANPHWNRYIAQHPPKHTSKSIPLEDGWVYAGAGTEPRKNGEPAQDPTTGYPLTGHLVGRQTWQFTRRTRQAESSQSHFDPTKNVNSADRLLRAQLLHAHGAPFEQDADERGHEGMVPVKEAVRDAVRFYSSIQCDDGHWAGDYGGPFFLLPGLIMMTHMTGFDLGPERRSAMLTYMRNHQQVDGGWALHLEGPSTMFGTVMQYVACRILGVEADDDICVQAREFIRHHGGATYAPSWCKLWLTVFGVYEYDGLNSIPPELWALPDWFPFHPGRMWCHARMVYLPMSWLYGSRARTTIGDLQVALRQELYVEPYEEINWNKARNTVAQIDLYSPHTKLMDFAHEILRLYEKCPIGPLRRAGLRFAEEYMHAEDLQTNYVDIGPVNKVMNMLCTYFQHGADSDEFRMHAARIADYLWVAEDGMKMQGYNGSQLWDTGFATQAILESGAAEEFPDCLQKIHSYVDWSQVKEDVPNKDRYYRIMSQGGWPFSTNDHGWPIADCTAEGLKAALGLRATGLIPNPIPANRLYDAVNLILVFQNADGGWATYERNRGWNWFEWLNPAEVFGDIMIDYSYTELTSACVSGLRAFQEQFPAHRTAEVSRAIRRGTQFVRQQQRPDGSWYGSWGVCFTYATWFGVEALREGGEPAGSHRFRMACDFLASKQHEDGGWGESYLSCVRKEYVDRPSTAFNTAWALLALIGGQCEDQEVVERGICFLLRRQKENGDWNQESVAGIFNRTCGISYTSYRNTFPIWALGAYVNRYQFARPELVEGPLPAEAMQPDESETKTTRRRSRKRGISGNFD